MPVRNFTLTGTRRNPARCSVWMADSDLMGARTDRAGVGGTTVRLRESPVVLNDSDTAAYYAIIRTRLQTRLAQCGSPRTRRSRWATCGRRRGQSKLAVQADLDHVEFATNRDSKRTRSQLLGTELTSHPTFQRHPPHRNAQRHQSQ